jgi:hypothetical protein
MVQKAEQHKKQVGGKSHIVRNISLIVVVAIVIGGAYFYYEYFSGGIGGAVYYAIISGNPSQAIQTAALQKLDSTPQFTLSYAGAITENITVNSIDPQVVRPFYLGYQKYTNASRISASFSGLPNLANESLVIIKLDGGSTVYVCLNQSGTGFKCTESAGSAQQEEASISGYFGLSSLGNLHIGTPTPSYFNGLPCFLVQGTGTLYGSTPLLQDSGNASLGFSACFSSDYYVPLTINATLTPAGSTPVFIHAYATNITASSNYTAVATLPGPLGAA